MLVLPAADPTDIFQQRDGVYSGPLLALAIVRLNLFSRLAERPASLRAICGALHLAERPADVMLTLFAAMGFLRNSGGKYHATKLARQFLDARSRWFLGPYFAALAARPECDDLLRVLRTGKSVGLPGQRKPKPWATAMRSAAFAKNFIRMMHCRALCLGPALAKRLQIGARRRLLDIGGGSGGYSCCILARHQRVRAAVFEKPPVDAIARAYISRMGFAKRAEVISGDMFAESLPREYDVHLFSNVLHDWTKATVAKLVRKSFLALPRDGMIAIHDSHLNRKKSGPLAVAAYSVLLMASTDGRCYSVAEIGRFLRDAGFVDVRFRKTVSDRSVITARKP